MRSIASRRACAPQHARGAVTLRSDAQHRVSKGAVSKGAVTPKTLRDFSPLRSAQGLTPSMLDSCEFGSVTLGMLERTHPRVGTNEGNGYINEDKPDSERDDFRKRHQLHRYHR